MQTLLASYRWDADAPVLDTTDEDGETVEGDPLQNVWRIQAHQTSAISCMRWDTCNAEKVTSIPLFLENLTRDVSI